MSFFGDESGNSGGNFLDPQQPIYVLALVGWPPERESEIQQAYQEACRLHGRARREWKAEDLLRSQSGRQFSAALLGVLANHNIPTVIGISEKRFLLSAMVVETLLDSDDDVEAPAQDDSRTRQAIAREIYRLFDFAFFKRFSDAVRADDLATLRTVGNAVAAKLDLHHDPTMTRVARAIRRGVDAPFRFGKKIEGTPERANRPHAGVHTLYPTLHRLDQWLVDCKLSFRT